MQIVIRVWNKQFCIMALFKSDKVQEEERAVDVSYPDGKDYQDLHGGTTTGYYTKNS